MKTSVVAVMIMLAAAAWGQAPATPAAQATSAQPAEKTSIAY